MLKKLITGRQCSDCRFCCLFDRSDIWEQPAIDDRLAEKLEAEGYSFTGGASPRQFKAEFNPEGLFACPMLGENGCRLGDNKPFDCRLWPFRVMLLGGFFVLTLSPFCMATNALPIKTILEFIENEQIAEIAFARAKQHPENLRHYAEGYPVFAVQKII